MRAALRALGLALALATLSAFAQPEPFQESGPGLAFSADGTALLAASDAGLAVYRDGEWSDVLTFVEAFSALAVTERAVYSSGHSSQRSNPVGLIRSTDGGRTWEWMALAGEANFAILAAGFRSGAIYVLNAQANAAMPASGLYVTYDEGKHWKRSEARGLAGQIRAIAAHPQQARTVAVAGERGLYLSRDAGETFARLDRREPVTAVAFDAGGTRLRYVRALSNRLMERALPGGARTTLRLPQLKHDYATCLAQNPRDERIIALATRKRGVYLTNDGGASWRRIALGQDAPEPEDAE